MDIDGPFEDRQAVAINLLQEGSLSDAEAALRALHGERPDAPEVNHFLGVFEFTQQRVAEAERLISRSLVFQPRNASAYANLAAVYLASDNLACAQLCCERALEIDPRLIAALDNLAIIFRAMGQYGESLAACERILAIDADNVVAHKNLGLAHLKLGEVDAAIEHLLAARQLKLSPDSLYQIGLSLYANGMHDLARPLFAEGLNRFPDDPMLAHMAAATDINADLPQRASDEYVATLFDNFADTFEDELEDLEYRVPGLIAEASSVAFAEHLDKPVRLLDLGCGTGSCGVLLKSGIGYALGVDLSRGMLEKARETGVYDELVEAELSEFLQSHQAYYDLIISGDTFCYLGDLSGVIRLAAEKLRSGGFLVFSVEAGPACKVGFQLTNTGRYVHHEQYVRDMLERAGLTTTAMTAADLRVETGQAVSGWVVTGRK